MFERYSLFKSYSDDLAGLVSVLEKVCLFSYLIEFIFVSFLLKTVTDFTLAVTDLDNIHKTLMPRP